MGSQRKDFAAPSLVQIRLGAGADLDGFRAAARSLIAASLPPEAVVLPVGGVGPDDMGDWWTAGARGFGLGSELYKPGASAEAVHARAARSVKAVRALMG